MKIVYVSRSIIPSRTANSINVMSMCNAFASLGHEVLLLAPWTTKLEEKNVSDIFEYYGVEKKFELKKLYIPNIKYLKKRLYSLRCLYEIKQSQPDFVYGRDDMLVFYYTYKLGFNVAFEKHEPFYANEFNDIFFKKLAIEYPNFRMITNSKKLKSMYVNDLNINSYEILAANNATKKVLDNKIPQTISFDKNRIQIGYVGSLFQGRGIDIIIELSQRIKNADFHIIGGNDKDINNWTSKINNKNITFHGFIEPKETYKYRNMCDILLAPYQSNKEGNRSSEYMSPIKIFEYMSSQKSIVISDLEVVYEVLDEDCALFVEYNNVDAWEQAVRNLIVDTKLRSKIASNAYNKFKNNYTWENRAKKIVDFLQETHTAYLTNDLFVGKGTNRTCFINPLDRTKCIKVTTSSNELESQSEIEYYKTLMNKSISFSNLAKYYGKINSDKGIGDVFELIKDYDGSVSKRLFYYLEDSNYDESIQNPFTLLDELFSYLKSNRIIVQDFNTKNILYQKINESEGKLIIIDGVRLSGKIELLKYFDFFVLKKIEIQEKNFKNKILKRYRNNMYLQQYLQEKEL